MYQLLSYTVEFCRPPLRHSHASLPLEMGFSPLLIAEQLGHEKVQTIMDTYSHLYPNKQVEVARQLDSLMV